MSVEKTVSILVAARNEAANILDCLSALDALSYPKDKLQILIGDDASEDNTALLVAEFIKEKPHFELVSIKESIDLLKGKANVLAQLAHHSTGEYLFFTDADIEVPPHWIENMLVSFKPNVGVVTGITAIEHPRPVVRDSYLKTERVEYSFQSLEWLYYRSVMRAMSLFEIPLTAMGNNMAVTRVAYDAVGGYEKIGFSITEDYALFRAILDNGFRFAQLYDRRVLTISKPVLTFKEMMIQRKRWMYGALSLPIGLRSGVFANGLLLPFLLILGLFLPKIAIGMAILGYVFTTIWLMTAISWLQQNHLFRFIPLFWFYHLFMNFAMLVNFYTSQTTVWKGRTY